MDKNGVVRLRKSQEVKMEIKYLIDTSAQKRRREGSIELKTKQV